MVIAQVQSVFLFFCQCVSSCAESTEVQDNNNLANVKWSEQKGFLWWVVGEV